MKVIISLYLYFYLRYKETKEELNKGGYHCMGSVICKGSAMEQSLVQLECKTKEIHDL